MVALLLLVIGGPAETIAGKYLQHSQEFLELYPPAAIAVPEPLPTNVDALCELIQKTGPQPRLLEALGDALALQKKSSLAYRAYDRAQRLGHPDSAALQRKKDSCEPVSDKTIRDEEREAEVWVRYLQDYERARIRNGEDPRGRELFYERFGRPEESLNDHIRMRQTAFWVAALSTLLSLGLVIGSGRIRKKKAAFPLAIAALCLLGPLLGAPPGPYIWAVTLLTLSAALIAWRGQSPT
ncbi:MAG: hypothetical protein AAGD14_06975 [Planctomycetota bacterium]